MVILKEDFDFFIQNMDTFYKNHPYKYVAIKGQNVIGIYDDCDSALENTMKTEKLGTFLVQKCVKNKAEMTHTFQTNVMPVISNEQI